MQVGYKWKIVQPQTLHLTGRTIITRLFMLAQLISVANRKSLQGNHANVS